MARGVSLRLENPFVVKSPEELTPEQVHALFVGEFTRLETVLEQRHTFIWGSRGSGKSILLRYLQPRCQALVHRNLERFFKRRDSFLGVLCPCKEGRINKTELTVLAPSAAGVMTEHLLNLAIAESVITEISFLLEGGCATTAECVRLAESALALFDRGAIATSRAEASSRIDPKEKPLEWLLELLEGEHRRVSDFLRQVVLLGDAATYTGATSGYHDFLLPFMRRCQQIEALRDVPIYLLLDDADRLRSDQASIVNTWIANRDQKTLCVKVTAQHERFSTFCTKDGGLIEQPHDYSEISFDELYTHSKSTYADKVRLIAEKRLKLSPIPTKSIAGFLPADTRETQMLADIRQALVKEWASKGEPGRQQDYVTRYAMARLFQQLAHQKQRKSYAGFQNLVDLSSGGVRDFLEPCYLMVDDYRKKGVPHSEMASIPTSLQDEVIFRYSEEFILNRPEDIRKGIPADEYSDLDALVTFVNSLGVLFYERLHDPESREARLFSFTVRGRVPDDIRRVLRLGVRHRYFQLRTYSRKEGGGREEWYILNRRLCPVFKLDPTGFEGRISLTAESIRLACQNPEKFVRLRLKRRPATPNEMLFELERGTDDPNPGT